MTGSRPLRLTAAVPSKDLMSVVTLSYNGRHLYLVPSRTAFFAMQSDLQAGVQQVADDLYSFFRDRRIKEIWVKRGPAAGAFQAAPGSTKFETILQLLDLTCHEVHVQKVKIWAKQDDWHLPLPQPGLRATVKVLQEAAILTAAFGIDCMLAASDANRESVVA